jgi:two-component system chemotaxis response regulator CheB
VAIGSSTGGPKLLEEIITGLPADLPVPIFIAQHLPPMFTETLALRMDRNSALSVFHAEHGMPVLPGSVYVARGREHMRVKRTPGSSPTIQISPEPQHLLFKPSVDELFESCAEVYGRRTLGVVLTGIGYDGTIGARAIHNAGGVILTQNAQSCAVYGMPKSCYEAGLSTAQLDIDRIRRAILQLSPGHHDRAFADPAA